MARIKNLANRRQKSGVTDEASPPNLIGHSSTHVILAHLQFSMLPPGESKKELISETAKLAQSSNDSNDRKS